MSSRKVLILAAWLLAGATAAARSQAGCAMELEVVGTEKPTVRIYDENGKLLGQVDKALALKQRAQECNESLGLIKIELADKRIVWVNRSESKRVLGIAQNSPVCVEGTSDDPDHTVGATNGVDPSATELDCIKKR